MLFRFFRAVDKRINSNEKAFSNFPNCNSLFVSYSQVSTVYTYCISQVLLIGTCEFSSTVSTIEKRWKKPALKRTSCRLPPLHSSTTRTNTHRSWRHRSTWNESHRTGNPSRVGPTCRQARRRLPTRCTIIYTSARIRSTAAWRALRSRICCTVTGYTGEGRAWCIMLADDSNLKSCV